MLCIICVRIRRWRQTNFMICYSIVANPSRSSSCLNLITICTNDSYTSPDSTYKGKCPQIPTLIAIMRFYFTSFLTLLSLFCISSTVILPTLLSIHNNTQLGILTVVLFFRHNFIIILSKCYSSNLLSWYINTFCGIKITGPRTCYLKIINAAINKSPFMHDSKNQYLIQRIKS